MLLFFASKWFHETSMTEECLLRLDAILKKTLASASTGLQQMILQIFFFNNIRIIHRPGKEIRMAVKLSC